MFVVQFVAQFVVQQEACCVILVCPWECNKLPPTNIVIVSVFLNPMLGSESIFVTDSTEWQIRWGSQEVLPTRSLHRNCNNIVQTTLQIQQEDDVQGSQRWGWRNRDSLSCFLWLLNDPYHVLLSTNAWLMKQARQHRSCFPCYRLKERVEHEMRMKEDVDLFILRENQGLLTPLLSVLIYKCSTNALCPQKDE